MDKARIPQMIINLLLAFFIWFVAWQFNSINERLDKLESLVEKQSK